MFEAAELGRKVGKKAFSEQEGELRTALLEAQRELSTRPHSVIVLVSGVEGAGKSAVVDRLNEWLDARGIETHAFWDETDDERERPRYWRFWRRMPPKGGIGIMFGSWYTQPIIDHVYGRIDRAEFERQMSRIVDFERMLVADGNRVVKLWFHIPESEQAQRLKKRAKQFGKKSRASKGLAAMGRKFSKRYREFAATSERAIQITDQGGSPWHIIEATDRRYRDLTAARILLQALQDTSTAAGGSAAPAGSDAQDSKLTVLDTVDLDQSLDDKQYSRRLKRYQSRLHQLSWQAHERRRSLVAVFEGWDASGKGGAIRRVTQALDARLYRVISVAAPTDEEKAQHYLWRFWRHLPRGGSFTLYDRSWYGRVLVERVEGFASQDEWFRAYQEINDFEEQLLEGGIAIAKFWIHISPDEQLRRFKERERTAWKQHKITDEDWRNREKWEAYAEAVNEMVARTSTAGAPWTLVAGNDKRQARVTVARTLCRSLESLLKD